MRYADDFLFLSKNKELLCKYVDVLRQFLDSELKLELHPDKIIFRKLEWGIDFLGYVVLPYYTVPRTKTRRRIFKRLKEKLIEFNNGNISEYSFNQTAQSYLGFLKHANSYRVTQELKEKIRESI